MVSINKFSAEAKDNLIHWMASNQKQFILAPWNIEGLNYQPDGINSQYISDEDYNRWFQQFDKKKSFVYCGACTDHLVCEQFGKCQDLKQYMKVPELKACNECKYPCTKVCYLDATKELSNDIVKRALRYNTDKLKWSLVHFKSLEPMVKVLEFGAKKYSADNWKKGLDKKEILESMMRHLTALMDGEACDPESGISHIGHIQCNAMFYSYFDKTQPINWNAFKDEILNPKIKTDEQN